MRYSEYEVCGIHSRLNHIIKSSGGYSIYAAARKLLEDYDIGDYDVAVEMAKDQNIRTKINDIGLTAVIQLTKEELVRQGIRFNSVVAALGSVVRQIRR